MKNIMSSFQKAITLYDLIEDNDKIAVAVSGGKDSMCLLSAFAIYKKFAKINFDVIAISIDSGFDGFDISVPAEYCKSLDIEFVAVKSQIKEIVFDIKKSDNPCSLCSSMRRSLLYDTAKKCRCNKIALGHNADDVIETLLMNMFFNGKIDTFAPTYKPDSNDITIIRPLILTFESKIKSSVSRNNIPVMKKCCPADGETKREFFKNLIVTLSKSIPYAKRNLLNAIQKSNIKGWIKKNG